MSMDRFLNSEFPFIREHSRGMMQDMARAIVIPNEYLPPHLQTHDEWIPDDRPGMGYNPSEGKDGKLYGTDLETIAKRLTVHEKQHSEHQKRKLTRAERVEIYRDQVSALDIYEDTRTIEEVEAAGETPETLEWAEFVHGEETKELPLA